MELLSLHLGGVATVLNEIASRSLVGTPLEESKHPARSKTKPFSAALTLKGGADARRTNPFHTEKKYRGE